MDNQYVKIKALDGKALGSEAFRKDFGLEYAYVVGGMYKAITSGEMIAVLSRRGILAFLGSGGLRHEAVAKEIDSIRARLSDGIFGVNIIHTPKNREAEEMLIDLMLDKEIRFVEAAAFVSVTPSLARYKIKGLMRTDDGKVISRNRIMIKISRSEAAEVFMEPITESIISELLVSGAITASEAELAAGIPLADAVTVETDSGGHTDGGVAFAVVPSVMHLRDRIMREYGYSSEIYIGAAGGIGDPRAIAAAFMMGADYVMTGSVNQCTVEAGTSDIVKDMLNGVTVHDMDYAPSADMFEMGARSQVLKRGTLYCVRAKMIYELYNRYDSLESIDRQTKDMLEKRMFHDSLENVFEEAVKYYPESLIQRANNDPKLKMYIVFKSYFHRSSKAALNGDEKDVSNFQINCGPAMGSFNMLVKGTKMENWRDRHADEIAVLLMEKAAEKMNSFFTNKYIVG